MLKTIRILDLAKGFAVIGVLLVHFSQLQGFFENEVFLTGNIFARNYINSGARGVQLFFIVSGFALTYNFQKYSESRNGLKTYFLTRFLRIFPLWTITICLYVLLGLSNGNILLNITLAFGFLRWQNPNPEIVIGGWSLFSECIYYLLLPAILKFSRGSRKRISALVLLSIIIRLIWLKGAPQVGISDTNSFVGLFPASNLYCFVVGIALHHFWVHKSIGNRSEERTKVGILVFITTVSLALGDLDQVFISIEMAMILFLTLSPNIDQKKKFSLIGKFGQYCYPIYLFQFVFFESLVKVKGERIYSLNSCQSTFLFLVLALTLLLLGYLVDRFFEKPIQKSGIRLMSRTDEN